MVHRLALGLAILFTATLVAADDKADAKKEADKLKGTWKFTSLEMDGKSVIPPGGESPTITFEGEKFTVKAGTTVVQAGTQKLVGGKKPNTVDATVTEGEGKGTTMLGIYEVDGDTLKACFDPTGKKRPTEFKSPAGSGYMLVVAKRAEKK